MAEEAAGATFRKRFLSPGLRADHQDGDRRLTLMVEGNRVIGATSSHHVRLRPWSEFGVIAAVAEFGRDLLIERTRTGTTMSTPLGRRSAARQRSREISSRRSPDASPPAKRSPRWHANFAPPVAPQEAVKLCNPAAGPIVGPEIECSPDGKEGSRRLLRKDEAADCEARRVAVLVPNVSQSHGWSNV